jgi:hypothetical protein
VFDRYVAFGNRYQAAQPAFAREKIVMAAELDWTAHHVPDPEESSPGIVQKAHVDAIRHL